MSRKVGFIDESGDKSIHYEKTGVTTFFVISAVIIDENSVNSIREEFKKISTKYTQAPEIKSNSKIFQNLDKRIEFLEKIACLDFRIYSIIVDKRKVFEDSGLKFRNSFYKYVNGLLDQELYDYYPYLELISDQHGTDKFMEGFINYVEQNHKQTELFKEQTFSFCDSKDEPLIQLADFISGSIAKCYEPEKFDPRNKRIIEILNQNILHLREWPETPLKFLSKVENADEQFDQDLVNFIFFRIDEFIQVNQDTRSPEIRKQLICLNYLIFRFKQDPYSYVYSDELLDRINVREINVTKRVLNKEIITKLRENKVLITSFKRI